MSATNNPIYAEDPVVEVDDDVLQLNATEEKVGSPRQSTGPTKRMAYSHRESAFSKARNSQYISQVESAAMERDKEFYEAPVPVRFNEEDLEDPLHPVMTFFQNETVMKSVYWILLVLLVIYNFAALIIDAEFALPIIYMELFVAVCIGLGYLSSWPKFKKLLKNIELRLLNMSTRKTYLAYILTILVAFIIAVGLSIDDGSKLYGMGGLAGLIILCYIFSWNRSAINWRPVIWGFSLQFVFGLFIIRTKAGENMFQFFGDQISVLQEYTNVGVDFVFGNQTSFAFTALPIIIFYSGLTSVLFYLGMLQGVTKAVGNVMVYTMGTSAPESLSAAGNIFLGQTEAPLLVRPYIKTMTNSELHAIMTGGFATIAGGVLAAFLAFGIPAQHLLSASVMSAPAALAISKIVYPETIKVDDTAIDTLDVGASYANVIEAFSSGASLSITLIANIIVNLIAFLAAIAFLNEIVSYLLAKIDIEDTNFQDIVGYIFTPCALLMGIPAEDLKASGEIIGIKIVGNEFLAFQELISPGKFDPEGRTFAILTYACCGFSNFSSIGIQLGGLGAMAPNKMKALSKMALSAMICGNIACFMTACIAGVLLP